MKLFVIAVHVAVFCALAFAGPLKVASFPVAHPVKTGKALKVGTKGVYRAVKAIVW